MILTDSLFQKQIVMSKMIAAAPENLKLLISRKYLQSESSFTIDIYQARKPKCYSCSRIFFIPRISKSVNQLSVS